MRLPTIKTAGCLFFMVFSFGLLGCDSSTQTRMSAEQISQDQKRFMQIVNECFLREYAALEQFSQPLEQTAVALRAQCLDEFTALRAAKLNYAVVRDVVEPPPRMVQFELEMAQVFVTSARARAMNLFKNHPPIPLQPNRPEQSEKDSVF